MVLVSADNLEVPGKRLAQHRATVAAAIAASVQHVVYTSAPAPHPTAEDSLINDHFWTEAAFRGSPRLDDPAQRSLYRSAGGGTGNQERQTLRGHCGGGGRGYVTRADCARAANGALLRAEGWEVLDVTGPEALTQD